MKKNNLVKLLGIALVVAITSTGVFYGLFVNKLSSNTGTGQTLLVAAKLLKPGAVLQEADLKTIPWPSPNLPKGTYNSAKQVVGNTVYDSIDQDEPLVASRLASSQATGTAVPPGMRAVSVHVSDSSGILALLHSGHKVDVQVIATRKGGDTEVRTALENLTVMSVRPQPEQSSQGGQNLPVVTLLASPSDADVLATADAAGHIRLALRNPQDQETRVRTAVTLDSIMQTPKAAKP